MHELLLDTPAFTTRILHISRPLSHRSSSPFQPSFTSPAWRYRHRPTRSSIRLPVKGSSPPSLIQGAGNSQPAEKASRSLTPVRELHAVSKEIILLHLSSGAAAAGWKGCKNQENNLPPSSQFSRCNLPSIDFTTTTKFWSKGQEDRVLRHIGASHHKLYTTHIISNNGTEVRYQCAVTRIYQCGSELGAKFCVPQEGISHRCTWRWQVLV